MKLKLTNPFAKPQHIKDMEEALKYLSQHIAYQANLVTDYSRHSAAPDPQIDKEIGEKMDEQIARYREITEILETQRKQRLSKEKKAEIIAYLIGILLILNYEHARALTSKATNQLPRILR